MSTAISTRYASECSINLLGTWNIALTSTYMHPHWISTVFSDLVTSPELMTKDTNENQGFSRFSMCFLAALSFERNICSQRLHYRKAELSCLSWIYTYTWVLSLAPSLLTWYGRPSTWFLNSVMITRGLKLSSDIVCIALACKVRVFILSATKLFKLKS